MVPSSLSSSRVGALWFAIVVVLAAGQPADGQTKTWTGDGGNFSWHDPDNWSPVGVPDASDDVLIDVPGEITVNIGQPASASAVTLANDLEITSTTLTISGGMTLDDANLTLTTDGSSAVLRFAGGAQTLGGTGQVLMNNQVGSADTILEPINAATLTIGPDITIRRIGSGNISSALAVLGSNDPTTAVSNLGTIVSEAPSRRFDLFGVFTNEGLIQAINGGVLMTSGSNSQFTNEGTVQIENSSLYLATLGGNWVNSGTITSLNSAISLGGEFTLATLGTFNRSGGTVKIRGILDLEGDRLHLDDVTGSWAMDVGKIANGTISTSGSAKLLFTNNGAFDAVTLATDIEIVSSNLTIYRSLILDKATVTLTTDGGIARLYFIGGMQTLGGTGQVLMNNQVGSSDTILEPISGATLTIGPDVSIRRVGSSSGAIGNAIIGSYDTSNLVINQGTISSEVLDRQIVLRGRFMNNGLIQAINGGTVAVGEHFGYQPEFTNDGTMHVVDSTLSLNGDWENLGTITAVNSVVNLGGDFTLTNLGKFNASGGEVILTGNLDLEGGSLNFDEVIGFWTIDGGTIANGTVSSGGSAEVLVLSNSTFDGVTLATDLEVVNQSLSIYNGLTLDNSTVKLTSYGSSNSARLRFLGGTQTLGGTGEVLMNNQAGPRDTVVEPTSNTSLIIGPGITIRRIGPGTSPQARSIIGSTVANSLVINQGTIISEIDGQEVQLPGDFTNEGVIQAINGGVVSLIDDWMNSGTITAVESVLNLGGNFKYSTMGSVMQTDGTVNISGYLDLEANNLHLDDVTGSWTMDGGTIANGVISSNGLAKLLITSTSTLDGVTLAMDLEILNKTLRINNGLALNNSTVKLTSNGNPAMLAFSSGTQTFGGTGEVLMQATTQDALISKGGNSTLTIGSNITIRRVEPVGSAGAQAMIDSGSSAAVINQGTIISDIPNWRIALLGNFTNEGSILVTNGGFITMFESDSQFTNEGTIHVEDSTLWLSGDWTNLGTITTIDSVIHLDGNFGPSDLGTFVRSGGTVNVTGTLDLDGGKLHLDAETGSWITNGGTIANGTISWSGSVQLLVSHGSVLDGVTLASDLEMHGMLTIRNGLTLDDSTLTLAPGWLRFNGPSQTLGGTGQVQMYPQSSGVTRIAPNSPNATLLIGPNITIRRVEADSSSLAIIGAATGTVINQGTIVAEANDGEVQLEGDFTNQGVIRAINGGIVVMAGSSSQFTNEGMVQVEDSALFLSGDWMSLGTITAMNSVVNLGGHFTLTSLGTLIRSGGEINLTGFLDLEGGNLHLDDETGSWTMDGGWISNGTIGSSGSAELLFAGNSTFEAVTLRTDVELDGVKLTIRNGLTLQDATLTLLSDAGISTLRFNGTQLFGGNGQVLIQTTAHDAEVIPGSNSTLIIGPDIVIRRIGQDSSPGVVAIIGSNVHSAAVVNEGAIVSASNSRDVQLEGRFTNRGVVQSIDGGIITTTGSNSQFTNEATVAATNGSITIESPTFGNYANGTLMGGHWEVGPASVLNLPSGADIHTLNDGAAVKLFGQDSQFSAIENLTMLAAGSSLQLADGRHFSANPQGGAFSNFGSLSADQSSRFTTAAHYVQGRSGLLYVGIASNEPPPTVAAGAAHLDGHLMVELVDGFAPTLGEGVVILSGSAGVSGQFATVTHPMAHPCMYGVTYGPTSVSAGLETVPPVAVCQNIVIELGSAGQATIAATDVDGGSSDNCEIQAMSVSPSSFTCFNIGTNVVDLTVIDAAGNVDSCEAIVTVLATDHYLGSPGGSWFQAGSWCAGAPTLETPVILGDLVYVDSLGAEAQSVQVTAGGELVIGAEGGASLEVADTVTVEAGGAITLIESGDLSATSVVIEAGGTLSITDPSARLVVSDLVIAPGATFNWSAGLIEIRGTWAHDQTVEVGCEALAAGLIVDNGLIIAPDVTICFDGVLGGNGVIAAAVSSEGLVSPGLSSGMLLIEGDYTQAQTGELLIEIRGLDPAIEHDVFQIAGQGALSGQLRVELIDDFMPAWGDTFTIMTAESLSGSFDAAVLPELEIPLHMNFGVVDNQVVLNVNRLGDLNSDGVVDVSDLLALLAAWRPCPLSGGCPADLNADGVVDVSDLLILLANWG